MNRRLSLKTMLTGLVAAIWPWKPKPLRWMARKRVFPGWKVEREFGLKSGTLTSGFHGISRAGKTLFLECRKCDLKGATILCVECGDKRVLDQMTGNRDLLYGIRPV